MSKRKKYRFFTSRSDACTFTAKCGAFCVGFGTRDSQFLVNTPLLVLVPDRKRSEKDPPQKAKLYVSARIFRVQSTMRKQKKSHMERLVQVAKQLAASLLARHHSGIPCHAKRGDKIASDLIHPQGAKRPCYVGKADVRGRSLPTCLRQVKSQLLGQALLGNQQEEYCKQYSSNQTIRSGD